MWPVPDDRTHKPPKAVEFRRFVGVAGAVLAQEGDLDLSAHAADGDEVEIVERTQLRPTVRRPNSSSCSPRARADTAAGRRTS